VRFVVLAAAVAVGTALVVAPPALGSSTYDANELWAYEDSVPLGERITMWECWKEGPGTNPRIDQRVGKKWVRLDVSSVARDVKTCGKNQPIKATYKFKVRDSLRWNKKEKTHEALVRTYCSGCVTYKWAIPVDK